MQTTEPPPFLRIFCDIVVLGEQPMIARGSVVFCKLHTLPQPTWTHVVVEPGCTITHRREVISCEPLLTASYGDEFYVHRDRLVPAPAERVDVPDVEEEDMQSSGSSSDGEREGRPPNSGDNRNLVDTNTAQSLTQEEIEELRRVSSDPLALAAQIAAGSATFLSKTKFSRAKYLRKKLAKHCPRLSLHKPTPLHLLLSQPTPDRVLNLRFDSLALLLAYANVQCGARVLVIDETTAGVVVGAVGWRLYADVRGAPDPSLGTMVRVVCVENDQESAATTLKAMAGLRDSIVGKKGKGRGKGGGGDGVVKGESEGTGEKGGKEVEEARGEGEARGGEDDTVVDGGGGGATTTCPSAPTKRPREAAVDAPNSLPFLPTRALWQLGVVVAVAATASVVAVPLSPSVVPFLDHSGAPEGEGADVGGWLRSSAHNRAKYGLLRVAPRSTACPLRALPGAVPFADRLEDGCSALPTTSRSVSEHGGKQLCVTGDCLVAAVGPSCDVYAVLSAVLPRLCVRRGGTFAVYCPAVTPLVQAFGLLKRGGVDATLKCVAKGSGGDKVEYHVINLTLFDLFSRSYVVAPERTHPSVTASGTGAILSGVVVQAVSSRPRPKSSVGALSAIAGLIGPQGGAELSPCPCVGCPCGSVKAAEV